MLQNIVLEANSHFIMISEARNIKIPAYSIISSWLNLHIPP